MDLRPTRPRDRAADPNYRQVTVSSDLADEWNAFSERQVEAGPAFGSQHVANALEFEVSLSASIPDALRRRVLAFDWWIRNHDRAEKNPNLLWSTDTRQMHVIDHDQAAHPADASIFWGTHLFKALAPAELEWLPKDLSEEFAAVANRLLPMPILAELPSEWTVNCDGVDWFVRHLAQSLKEPPHRDWRNHD